MAFDRKLFRQLRKQRGLSVQQLASLMDCSPSLISNVESDKDRNFSLETFAIAVQVLGTSADRLLGLTNTDCVYDNAYKRAQKDISKRIKNAVEHQAIN